MNKSLCNDCKYQFTRVFIPTKPEEFIDENGNQILEGFNGDSDTITISICLLSEMDVDVDITTECSHYLLLKDEEKLSLFKHLKD